MPRMLEFVSVNSFVLKENVLMVVWYVEHCGKIGSAIKVVMVIMTSDGTPTGGTRRFGTEEKNLHCVVEYWNCVNLFEYFQMLVGIYLTCAMKCFPSIWVWPNPNPSLFLGNVKWKLVKQYKTVIYTVFALMQFSLLVGNYLKYGIKCFPQFRYGQSQFIIIFRQCPVEACQII